MAGKHLLAHRIEQKRGLAVQRTAADGLHKTAQQPGGQGRLEQHRAFGGGQLAAIQACQRTFGGIAAHGLRAGQIGGIAHGAVPVVALHLGTLACDGGHRQAVARAGIAAAENAGLAPLATAHVRRVEVRLLGRHARALAVGDFFADTEGSGLARQRQLHRTGGSDGPGVKQLKVGPIGGHVFGVGQAGKRVFGGEAGNVVGRLHRLLNGRQREIGGGRVAPAVSNVHRHAQGFVAVALHVFQLALAHRHAQAAALRGLGPGIGGPQLAGVIQRSMGQLFKLAAAVLKTALRLVGGQGGRAGWGAGHGRNR